MTSFSHSPRSRGIAKRYETISYQSRPGRNISKWFSTASTAMANFAAQYNFQSIAVSLLIMSQAECTTDEERCKDGEQQAWVKGTANAVIFIGAIVGQLSMGFLGDYLSRNAALATTLAISSLAALLSSVAPAGNPSTVYSVIIAFRFIIGIGLGGIFPLSATKASEDSASSSNKTNSAGPAFAFLWQVPGLLSPWLLALWLSYGHLSAGMRWRLVLGLGAVPAALSACLLGLEVCYAEKPSANTRNGTNGAGNVDSRMGDNSNGVEIVRIGGESGSGNTSESAHNSSAHGVELTADNKIDSSALDDVAEHSAVGTSTTHSNHTSTPKTSGSFLTFAALLQRLQDPSIRSKLLVCGGAWFLYDVVFYGLSLLGGVVLSTMNSDDDNVSDTHSIRAVCTKQSIALSLSILPIVLTVLLLRCISLKEMQCIGFVVQATFLILFVALFSLLQQHSPNGLFALYCMALMSLQLGVPVATYSLPASLFEKDVRCSFNGIASAMGKLGAVVGAYSFYYIAQASIHAVLLVCVAVCLLGAYLTYVGIDEAALGQDESTSSTIGSSAVGTLRSGKVRRGMWGMATLRRAVRRTGSMVSGGSSSGERGGDDGSDGDEVIVFSPLPDDSIHAVAAEESQL